MVRLALALVFVLVPVAAWSEAVATVDPSGAVAAAQSTADNAATAAANAQDAADDAAAAAGALCRLVESTSDPSGACGYAAGDNCQWAKTNATQTSSRFCWCSDPSADEWACMTGEVP